MDLQLERSESLRSKQVSNVAAIATIADLIHQVACNNNEGRYNLAQVALTQIRELARKHWLATDVRCLARVTQMRPLEHLDSDNDSGDDDADANGGVFADDADANGGVFADDASAPCSQGLGAADTNDDGEASEYSVWRPRHRGTAARRAGKAWSLADFSCLVIAACTHALSWQAMGCAQT